MSLLISVFGDHMRGVHFVVIVAVVLCAVTPLSLAEKRKILIDYSHGETMVDLWKKPQLCFDIFEDAYEIVESQSDITYKNIQDYDMLLVCKPHNQFDSSETEAITRFVNNGGGLLLIFGGWQPQYEQLEAVNSLSEMFGVIFTEYAFRNREIGTQNKIHPVFQEVESVALSENKCYILDVGRPSTELLHYEGKCVLACCEYGEGRVFFLPDPDFISYPHVDAADNRQFVINVFNWLTGPGGPYLHGSTLEKGLSLMEEGRAHLASGEYALAKSLFITAKANLETAFSIYESDTIMDQIELLDSLIADAETGEKADALLEEGKSLYESGQVLDAIAKLEEAQTLFQSINGESEECAVLIQKWKAEMTEQEPEDIQAEDIGEPEDVQVKDVQVKEPEPLPKEDTFMLLIVFGGAAVGAALVVGVILRLRPEVTEKPLPSRVQRSPDRELIEKLKYRLAKGEITLEEYEKTKKILEKE